MPTRKLPTSSAAPSLTMHAFKLTNEDAEILENLAKELSDRTGRASSRSMALRALIRLSETFDGTLMARLADAAAKEVDAGLRWGRDSQKQPV